MSIILQDGVIYQKTIITLFICLHVKRERSGSVARSLSCVLQSLGSIPDVVTVSFPWARRFSWMLQFTQLGSRVRQIMLTSQLWASQWAVMSTFSVARDKYLVTLKMLSPIDKILCWKFWLSRGQIHEKFGLSGYDFWLSRGAGQVMCRPLLGSWSCNGPVSCPEGVIALIHLRHENRSWTPALWP